MLVDPYGRQFRYLRLSITDQCNYRCDYCLPDGNDRHRDRAQLSLTQIDSIVAAFAHLGTQKVRLTGGEPSLRKDLTDIIAQVRQHSGIRHIALTTNGFMLEKQVEHWADAGLDSVNISIDSLDPKLFSAITGHDHLDRILRGIDKALSLGISVKVNSVLMKNINSQALAGYLNWIRDLPITLRFIELMQTGHNTQFFNQRHVSAQGIKHSLLQDGWQMIKKPALGGPAEEFSHVEYSGKVGVIMPYSPSFCSSCNRLRVSSKGRLHLCLFADQGYDLLDDNVQPNVQSIKDNIKRLVNNKVGEHYLHQGNTGGTENLAIIGG
ncbi:GTP 3',8-cyclase MoaA [Alteromonas facilis]|uniref:GTP 3',8-cyclase MoaA n=1 Tax=Alteromonas facilis TaxID=2048004 RepID=UPI000C28ACA6|nr:GTP 3',8-cyclase MoaA [Alteromonas facilis]